jgi:ABC-type sugar transport system substrate-binding protein
MKTKIWLAASLILVLGMVLGACAPQPAAPVEEPVAEEVVAEEPVVEEPETYEVTLILKDSTSAGWRYLSAAAVAKGLELEMQVAEISPLKTQDAEEQYKILEDQIEKGVDAIIIAPVDSAGIVPAIEKANEAGIPVFQTNTRAFVEDENDVVTFVGVENETGGYDIAKYMFSLFGADEQINLIIMDGNRTGQTTIDRIAGIERAIAEDPRVTVLDVQEAKFSRAQAQTTMENFLVKYDNINLVIALNDEMAIGSYNAINAAGRTAEMKISGFDGAPEGLQAILDGWIVATLNQDLPGQGSLAVEAVKTFLDGGTVEKWVKTGGDVVTVENAAEFLARYPTRSY